MLWQKLEHGFWSKEKENVTQPSRSLPPLKKEKAHIRRLNFHKKKEKRPCFYPHLIRRFFHSYCIQNTDNLVHYCSEQQIWIISMTLKSMSVYLLVPPAFSPTHLLPRSPCCWKAQSFITSHIMTG